jgi:hypothetical protein
MPYVGLFKKGDINAKHFVMHKHNTLVETLFNNLSQSGREEDRPFVGEAQQQNIFFVILTSTSTASSHCRYRLMGSKCLGTKLYSFWLDVVGGSSKEISRISFMSIESLLLMGAAVLEREC